MARKRSRKAESKPVQNNTSFRSDKLLITTVVLLAALLILNVISITGYTVKFNTGINTIGDSSCFRFGGLIFREGVTADHNGHAVTLVTVGDNAIAVNVDGETRTVKSGHDIWINGVIVNNFASGTDDACLILS